MSASHGHSVAGRVIVSDRNDLARTSSRIAVRIRRAVAAFEPHLVRQLSLGPGDEEFRVELEAAIGAGVELHHPAVESAFVELAVDRAIERIGEIDAPAVAADLDHLRPAGELAVLGARV